MTTRLKPMFMAIVGAAVVAPTLLQAHTDPETKHALGDHPAVIIYKAWSRSAYTEKSAIYPHPAEIWWYTRDPNSTNRFHPKKSVD